MAGLRSGLAVAAACILTSCTGWQSSFNAQAPQSEEIRHLLLIFIAIATAIWIAVMLVLLFGLLRRARESRQPLDLHLPFEHRAGSVIYASGIATTLTVLVLSVVSYGAQRTVFANEPNPVTVKITGHQWWWEVQYQADSPHLSFLTANEIRVPVGQPVTVELESADVIHSFWVPSLTGKMDLITGQKNSIQFTAKTAGVYRGQCAEFCGTAARAYGVHGDRVAAGRVQPLARPREPACRKPKRSARQSGRATVSRHGLRPLPHHPRHARPADSSAPTSRISAAETTIAAGTLPHNAGNARRMDRRPATHQARQSACRRCRCSSDEMIAILHYLEQLK